MKQNVTELKTKNGREKAQESQMGISVLEPFASFRGNSVGVNPPSHVIAIQSGSVAARRSQSQRLFGERPQNV
jgi:hypothetical protein